MPTNASFLNRIECHFRALRYFALDGTDHRSHDEQNSMIRRYIAWRNRHKDNQALRAILFAQRLPDAALGVAGSTELSALSPVTAKAPAPSLDLRQGDEGSRLSRSRPRARHPARRSAHRPWEIPPRTLDAACDGV